MMLVSPLQSLLSVVVVVSSVEGSGYTLGTDGEDDMAAKFSAFIQQHQRSYSVGSDEYHNRFELFQKRVAAVDAHNQQAVRSWTAAVNSLADRTPSELAMLRGYRHTGQSSRASSLGLASVAVHSTNMSRLPVSFTWKGLLNATKEVQNQGGCGSCWAVASATVLRAHAELYQQDRTFSVQQIVDCTPNPLSCGGRGGCGGATAELAMEYAQKAGVVTDEEHGYVGMDTHCPPEMMPPTDSVLAQISNNGRGGAAFGMTGYHKLPENKPEPLLIAVYDKGPVVVSVSATDQWSMYSSGIIKACDKEAVINHAVVLVGYGKEQSDKSVPGSEDGGKLYWHVQNSWGSDWGEGGFIRLLRLDRHEEGGFCGYDTKPEDGTGCKGGPAKVWVCGNCGILYDSVVPQFSLSETGFLSRHVRDSSGTFTLLESAPAHLRR